MNDRKADQKMSRYESNPLSREKDFPVWLNFRGVGSWLLIGVLISLLIGSPVSAQGGNPDVPPPTIVPTVQTSGQSTLQPAAIPVSADQVNVIAHNLYCPVCANTPLDVCPTTACIRWRAQIADLIGQGDNEEQIRQYFIDHFGMRTVAIPTDSTSQVIVLGLPYVLIALAGLLIVWQLWRWRRKTLGIPAEAIDPPPAESDIADDYLSRFEAEVKDEN
jgi:cytochrome c-type biogenesis protein CcmH